MNYADDLAAMNSLVVIKDATDSAYVATLSRARINLYPAI
jgi:hypothetical protein